MGKLFVLGLTSVGADFANASLGSDSFVRPVTGGILLRLISPVVVLGRRKDNAGFQKRKTILKVRIPSPVQLPISVSNGRSDRLATINVDVVPVGCFSKTPTANVRYQSSQLRRQPSTNRTLLGAGLKGSQPGGRSSGCDWHAIFICFNCDSHPPRPMRPSPHASVGVQGFG
ncbi:hypothetical protein BX600DRAFT_299404 [Xylariales sp. PMI_506]|nr:hypothetical protein BX600DRAFT_299404 [Xylariales sp. PMI_506]